MSSNEPIKGEKFRQVSSFSLESDQNCNKKYCSTRIMNSGDGQGDEVGDRGTRGCDDNIMLPLMTDRRGGGIETHPDSNESPTEAVAAFQDIATKKSAAEKNGGRVEIIDDNDDVPLLHMQTDDEDEIQKKRNYPIDQDKKLPSMQPSEDDASLLPSIQISVTNQAQHAVCNGGIEEETKEAVEEQEQEQPRPRPRASSSARLTAVHPLPVNNVSPPDSRGGSDDLEMGTEHEQSLQQQISSAPTNNNVNGHDGDTSLVEARLVDDTTVYDAVAVRRTELATSPRQEEDEENSNGYGVNSNPHGSKPSSKWKSNNPYIMLMFTTALVSLLLGGMAVAILVLVNPGVLKSSDSSSPTGEPSRAPTPNPTTTNTNTPPEETHLITPSSFQPNIRYPTSSPTLSPLTRKRTRQPTTKPTYSPSVISNPPSLHPTGSNNYVSTAPSYSPTADRLSLKPSSSNSNKPSRSSQPSTLSSEMPSVSSHPSDAPTQNPSLKPSSPSTTSSPSDMPSTAGKVVAQFLFSFTTHVVTSLASSQIEDFFGLSSNDDIQERLHEFSNTTLGNIDSILDELELPQLRQAHTEVQNAVEEVRMILRVAEEYKNISDEFWADSGMQAVIKEFIAEFELGVDTLYSKINDAVDGFLFHVRNTWGNKTGDGITSGRTDYWELLEHYRDYHRAEIGSLFLSFRDFASFLDARCLETQPGVGAWEVVGGTGYPESCRTSGTSNYVMHQVGSEKECMDLCVLISGCHGVEYGGSSGCGVWMEPIEYSVQISTNGTKCLRFHRTSSDTNFIPVTDDESPFSILGATTSFINLFNTSCLGGFNGEGSPYWNEWYVEIGETRCKKKCLAKDWCYGYENRYHSDRGTQCYMWKEPIVDTAVAKTDFQEGEPHTEDSCHIRVTSTLDVVWHELSNTVCRGGYSGVNNYGSYYDASGSQSIAQCQSVCEQDSSCHGIEYTNNRCEIWKVPLRQIPKVEFHFNTPGFKCMKIARIPRKNQPIIPHECTGLLITPQQVSTQFTKAKDAVRKMYTTYGIPLVELQNERNLKLLHLTGQPWAMSAPTTPIFSGYWSGSASDWWDKMKVLENSYDPSKHSGLSLEEYLENNRQLTRLVDTSSWKCLSYWEDDVFYGFGLYVTLFKVAGNAVEKINLKRAPYSNDYQCEYVMSYLNETATEQYETITAGVPTYGVVFTDDKWTRDYANCDILQGGCRNLTEILGSNRNISGKFFVYNLLEDDRTRMCTDGECPDCGPGNVGCIYSGERRDILKEAALLTAEAVADYAFPPLRDYNYSMPRAEYQP